MKEKATVLGGSKMWNRSQRALPLAEAARRATHYKWLESTTFEAMGGFVPMVPEQAVKLTLSRHSHHHSWHAGLWHNHIPETPGINPDRIATAPNAHLERFAELLLSPGTPESTVEKLVGIYRVLLPYKIASYSTYLSEASFVTEAPVIRSLELMLRDEMQDWREGEILIQQLIKTADDVRRAGSHQAELETILVEAQGILGADTVEFDHQIQAGSH